MKITAALKAFSLSKDWIGQDDSDDTIKGVVTGKLVGGELSPAKFAELCQEAPALSGKGLLAEVVKEAMTQMNKNNQPTSAPLAAVASVISPVLETVKSAPAPSDYSLLNLKNVNLQNSNGDTVEDHQKSGASFLVQSAANVTVKAPSGYYRKEQLIGKHKSTNEPVMFQGGPVYHSSEYKKAMLGVWFRSKVLRSPYASRGIRPLDEHEKSLLEEMFNTEKFYTDRGDQHDVISGMEAKAALLDSGVSGGNEIVPYWFDDVPITYPLLHSELLPYVDIRDVPRGSTTKGGSIGNPTVSWGTAEGTALTLFDTASLVGAFDTTIYPIMIGVEIGIDFLSDSPMQVGAQLEMNIGQAFMKEMDNVIANGSGSSRPTGFFLASGTTLVPSINGGAGDLEVADLENLMFAVGKQYRAKQWNSSFVMNDTTYARLRGIPVSPTDQRRVFGLDSQSYKLFDYPVRIQNDTANTKLAFISLMRHILYRRRGWDFRTVTEGVTLARTNTVVLFGRGRFGGKLSDGAAMSYINDGPA